MGGRDLLPGVGTTGEFSKPINVTSGFMKFGEG
jgi:hypothetical protein